MALEKPSCRVKPSSPLRLAPMGPRHSHPLAGTESGRAPTTSLPGITELGSFPVPARR